MLQHSKSALLILFAFTLLSSCASKPKVHALFDPAANFSKYQTYNFADKLTIDQGKEYDSFITRYLKAAVNKEMALRGIRKSDKPDLLVNFHIKTKEKIRVHDNIHTPSYYHYRYGYHPWAYYSYESRVTQYTEGTLNIDLVDAKAKQLVWEGVAVGRVRQETTEDMQLRINSVVNQIFQQLPIQSISGAGT